MSLVATNILGQNTPAIAAKESQYGEMWVQDIVAMEGYAGSSAAASNLTAITPPPPSANPAGLAAQSTSAASTAAADISTIVDTIIAIISNVDLVLTDVASSVSIAIGAVSLGVATASLAKMYGAGTTTDNPTADTQPNTSGELVSTRAPLRSPSSAGPGLGAVSASTGRAASLGALSVPPTWALSPAIRQVASVLPTTGGTPIVVAGNADNPYANLVLASLAGSSIAGLASRGGLGANPAAARVAAAPAATTATTPASPTPKVVPSPTGAMPPDLAATLASMPGATVIVIPPAQTAS
jgi:PPE-repeat protein